MNKLLSQEEINALLSKQGKLKDAPLRDFFTDSNITHSMLEGCEEILKMTKELISELEESEKAK